jgi:outer membrane protein assembly factor BamB
MLKRTVSGMILTLLLIGVHGCGFLCLFEDAPPQWRNQKQSALTIAQGGYVSLQAEGMDAVSLDYAVLSTNETGVWRNETEYAFLWRQEAVYGFDNFGTATYKDGVLYAPSKGDNNVYAIDATDGDIVWNRTVRQCDASPCVDGDVVYVGECFSVTEDPVLNPKAIALNKTNGKEIWNYTDPQGYGWVGSPIVHEDYVYYTTGYYNYATGFMAGSGIYALNKTDGQKIWQKEIGFLVCSAAYHERVVFVSGSNYDSPQGQYALNATNGNIIWHVNYGPSWDSSPVVYNGMVIQVARDTTYYPYPRTTFVLNETDGQLIWKFDGKGSPSTPLVHDGKVFIPDDDRRMWAFDLETGEEVWHTVELHNGFLQDNSYCSPAASGGGIYYQSLNGTFYVINETDGSILWTFTLGDLGFGSPSIGDGCVFITNDFALYAFRIGPGSGDWSMFCQNKIHQSYSEQGVEYLRWLLIERQYFKESNVWVTAKFIWCNKTITSAAIAWRIYFFDNVGNVNATDIMIFYVHPPVHDVAVVNVTAFKTVVGSGFNMSIQVTVRNDGDLTETFNVTAYTNSTIIKTQTASKLGSGFSKKLTFTWNTTGVAKGNYTISAYAHPVPSETDTADNVAEAADTVLVTVPGDVSGDRVCDMLDISILIDKFMTTPSDPTWDPNCDINSDNSVDMLDISIAIDHFMEGW